MFYNYKIKKIERVVDGDTFDAFIDLGFNTLVKKRIRIYGINCPECRTRNKKEKEKGLLAKKFLQQIFESFENSISINSKGIGKYGRVLAEVKVDKIGEEKDVAEFMISNGHAEEYYGGKR